MISVYLITLRGKPIYVGATTVPKSRLSKHRWRWGDVKMRVLETVHRGSSSATEKKWIAHFLSEGAKLRNQSERTDPPHKHSPRTKMKLAHIMKGNTRAAGNTSRLGVRLSAEVRARMSASQLRRRKRERTL